MIIATVTVFTMTMGSNNFILDAAYECVHVYRLLLDLWCRLHEGAEDAGRGESRALAHEQMRTIVS